MQLHTLTVKHKRPSKKRVGRGGKRGTYSGSGMKGQNARAGGRPAPVVRELLKRYPKLKGYTRVRRQRKAQSVSLAVLAKRFLKDEIVSPITLIEKGLIHQRKSSFPQVKIIGSFKVKTVLSIQGCALSPGAKKAIEESGGSVT